MMTSEQHLTTIQYGEPEANGDTILPSENFTDDRTANRHKLLMSAFVAAIIGMIAIQFLG